MTRTHRPGPTPLDITHLDSCDSTNQWLLAAAEAGAPGGRVVVAREQTAGRGRRGRRWVAEPGKTLAFSLLWTFPLAPTALDGLSLAVGVGIVRALRAVEGGGLPDGFRIGLKWPNDILLRRPDGADAKLGGVLIESVVRTTRDGARELAVVIGVGLNCLTSMAVDSAVTDQPVAALDEAIGNVASLTPDTLLPMVLSSLGQTLDAFTDNGFVALRDAWLAMHLWEGAAIRISENGQPLQDGVIRGVDIDGALCIATPSGIERVIAGDVSLRKV